MLKIGGVRLSQLLYFHNLINIIIINDFRSKTDVSEIINYINSLNNKNFSKVIKIYILKLIFNFQNRI